MTDISVTNSLDDNAATSDITLVGTNFDDVINGLTDGTKDIAVATTNATKLVATVASTQSITAAGGISGSGTYLKVSGNGGAINITANPQISAGSTGQIIIVEGQSDTNTVKLDDGTGLLLSGAQSFTLGLNDTIQLLYNGTNWVEITRSNN